MRAKKCLYISTPVTGSIKLIYQDQCADIRVLIFLRRLWIKDVTDLLSKLIGKPVSIPEAVR